MSNFFIRVYRFFKRHRITFLVFCISLLAGMIILASRITFEENISGERISNGNHDHFEYVVHHFKFFDKLVVRLYQADTNAPADPRRLIDAAASFTGKLSSAFDSSTIKSVTGAIPDTLMAYYFNFFYDHLPIYLTDEDYRQIEKSLLPDSIEKTMRNNYRMLVSPASFALKNVLVKDPLGFTMIPLQKMRTLASGDNFVIEDGYIMTSDRKNLLIFITSANPASESKRNGKLIKGVGSILSTMSEESNGQVKGEYFGSIAVASANADRLKKDITITFSISIGLIILLLAWYFKSIKYPLLGFLPALFGGAFALSIMYITKGTISAIALGIGTVILGLIVDYALYIINHFRKTHDIEATLEEMSLTIFLCFLTSAAAFICLVFLKSGVLHDLGWFASLSVAGAAFFALVLLPHFLDKRDFSDNPGRTEIINSIVSVHFEKKYGLITIILLLTAGGLFLIRKTGFEKNMMSINYMTDELRKGERNLDRLNNASMKNVYLVSTGKDLASVLKNHEKNEFYVRSVNDGKFLVQQSAVGLMLPSDSVQAKRLNRWEQFWTPERKDNLRKRLIETGKKYKFRESAFNPVMDLLYRKFSPMNVQETNRVKIRFLAEWINETPEMTMISTIIKVPGEKKELVSSAFSGHPNLVVFDRQLISDRLVENVRHDFDLLVRLSMIFVSLLLILSFGRIELGLIAALPMFLSWVITLGFMGAFDIRFNIINIIISSFIFGLGVDYSILMMRGLLHNSKYGLSELTTYKTSIFLSAITTLIGVGALFFARHPALNSIALISVVGITSVVVISFTIQPWLMNLFLLDRQRQGIFPITARIVVKTFVTWGNIVLISVIMVIFGSLIFILLPVPKKRKQYIFHKTFSMLCRAYIAFTFPIERKLLNPLGEDFVKPAIIISNHQSLIETPAFLRLYPKIIILTTAWVYKSPVFGPIARMASYFNADEGIDAIMDKLKDIVADGYSILIFPEGHRSDDHNIRRFHRGAFYLSEKLKVDILPIVVFGSGDFLPRGVFWGKPNGLYMKIQPRVAWDDTRFGTTVSEKTRGWRQHYIHLYDEFRSEMGTPDYYRRMIALNYIFKGPVLEWYVKIKMRLEKNYRVIDSLMPRKGDILDIGCGYGYISYILAFTSKDRMITAIDYDPEKIAVANNCYAKNDRITFISCDITKYPVISQDAFLMSDILHYLPEPEQEKLLRSCMTNLKKNGVIIIRDADQSKKERHAGTRLTEFFSTRSGFNKTIEDSGSLYFTSQEMIRRVVDEFNLNIEVIDDNKLTSNILIIIRP